jgi:hypothetical protein
MLVLTRRPAEKIVIPDLGATVEVVAVKPGVVRLGVVAPAAVGVFQKVGKHDGLPRVGGRAEERAARSRLRRLNRLLRNRLNAATVSLALLRRQVQAGLVGGARATLAQLEQEFSSLREQVHAVVAKAASDDRAPGPLRALVIGGDGARSLLAVFLRLAGLAVATVGDGADALDYLRRRGRRLTEEVEPAG